MNEQVVEEIEPVVVEIGLVVVESELEEVENELVVEEIEPVVVEIGLVEVEIEQVVELISPAQEMVQAQVDVVVLVQVVKVDLPELEPV